MKFKIKRKTIHEVSESLMIHTAQIINEEYKKRKLKYEYSDIVIVNFDLGVEPDLKVQEDFDGKNPTGNTFFTQIRNVKIIK